MPLTEWIAKALTWLASPMGCFALGTALGVIVHRLGRRKAGRALMGLAWLQLLAFSWMPVAEVLAGPLERWAARLHEQAPARGYDDIVLLGGAVQPTFVGERGPGRLSPMPERVWCAERLYREGVARRIVVSAGHLREAAREHEPAEADAIADMLQVMGVPAGAIVRERRSGTTRENMLETRKLVDRGARVAIVTTALHMPRAMTEAGAAGLHASAFPCDWRVLEVARPATEWWLPGVTALRLSTLAIKEWIGLEVLRWGRGVRWPT